MPVIDRINLSVREVGPDFYEVSRSAVEWWTAKALANGWLVTNAYGRQLKSDGNTGRRVVRACIAFRKSSLEAGKS